MQEIFVSVFTKILYVELVLPYSTSVIFNIIIIISYSCGVNRNVIIISQGGDARKYLIIRYTLLFRVQTFVGYLSISDQINFKNVILR